jgi:hypothetical protein
MKRRAAQFFLLLAFAMVLLGISGCSTDEPVNNSVRPWNAPQGWENGLPMMDQQHPQ